MISFRIRGPRNTPKNRSDIKSIEFNDFPFQEDSEEEEQSFGRKMISAPILQSICVLMCYSHAEGWSLSTPTRIASVGRTHRRSWPLYSEQDESWSVSDNWDSLSSENPNNCVSDSADIFNQDIVLNAALEMEDASIESHVSEEDVWIEKVVDEIQHSLPDDETPLYDYGFEEEDQGKYVESMDQEIAMLVRCNENPDTLLVSEGRALPPLTTDEKNDVMQLVQENEASVRATPFLEKSVSKIFRQHAREDPVDHKMCLDRDGIARWMTRCLKTEEGRVGSHDKRVLKTLSDFSSYGSGRLLERDLQNLYLSTILGHFDVSSSNISLKRHLSLRQSYINAVWRDLRNHGILSPVEQERLDLDKDLGATSVGATLVGTDGTVMDECELLEWDSFDTSVSKIPNRSHDNSRTKSRSSHQGVEMTPGSKSPLLMRDGEFIFIDEESCIGCMQCVNVCPNSFHMLDSGRARTFVQRNSPDVKQAVSSCPVSCMHPVSYDELVEFETARDEGDGRTDHKHLGHRRGHTPLFVAGIDSDNNHRSSWYHTLKSRCLVSSKCPQRGCYDCPKFSNPGDNPYFKRRQREDEHRRAQFYIENGDADIWRKTADL